jgi:hypothetical protein
LLSVLFSEPDMGTDTLIQLGKGWFMICFGDHYFIRNSQQPPRFMFTLSILTTLTIHKQIWSYITSLAKIRSAKKKTFT